MRRTNRLLSYLSIFIVIVIFLVISVSGKYLKGRIFYDDKSKQPINNIKSVEEDVISYVYTKDKSLGNYIYLTNQFPITDEVGKSLEGKFKTFDFTFKFNEKAAGVKYTITLEKLKGTDLREDWVKVYLVNEGKEIKNCIRDTGRIKTYNEYKKYGNNEIILYSGVVSSEEAKRGYKNYTFRMWVSEDVELFNENYEERTFIARVNLHATGDF